LIILIILVEEYKLWAPRQIKIPFTNELRTD
jgi:hypothetical protein